MDSASKALSASLYRSSVSMMELWVRSSASAAERSWCDIEARTRGLVEVGVT